MEAPLRKFHSQCESAQEGQAFHQLPGPSEEEAESGPGGRSYRVDAALLERADERALGSIQMVID